MASVLFCDVCGKECSRVVGKMFFGPIKRGTSAAIHSNYTHHLDVGECCQSKIMRGLKWRKRLTAAEYHEMRRAKSA